jgi:hypothetical protein
MYNYRGIKADIIYIVGQYEDYTRNKAAQYKPYGELKLLLVPSRL